MVSFYPEKFGGQRHSSMRFNVFSLSSDLERLHGQRVK